jgi:opacity protein-like surface antigen
MRPIPGRCYLESRWKLKKLGLVMIVAALLCLGWAAPPPTLAAGDNYLVLRGGPGWSDDVTRQGNLSPVVNFKDIWDLGVAYGRKFNWLRLEGEFSYIHAKVDDVSRTDGVSLNGSGQERHYVFMVNAFADWHNQSAFTPFVGVGAGAAYINHDLSFFRPRRSNTITSDDHAWSFAYQFMAGASWDINPSWSLELMYRYYGLTHRSYSQVGSAVNNVTSVELDPQQIHFVLVGVRFSF